MLKKKLRTDVEATNVNKMMCETCPFRQDDNGEYLDPRLTQRIKNHVITQSNHICHSTGKTICRGSRDYQLYIFSRAGIIPAPTDEAYAIALDEARAQSSGS